LGQATHYRAVVLTRVQHRLLTYEAKPRHERFSNHVRAFCG
jgi:hypothetical protein